MKAWGSGQNALYAYMLIPFVQIMGLTQSAVRLPMAIMGSIAIIVMYKLLKQKKDEKLAIIGTIFLVICPWHIMKSRWGLESNILPELILFAVYFLEKYRTNRKKHNLYISAIILGISTYSYGTTYFFLPIFTIIMLIYLKRKQEITISQALIYLAMVAIIALPMIVCVMINTFDLPQINLPFMTIPRMTQNRYEELTSIFSSQFMQKSFSNFFGAVKMLIVQNDELPWNAMKFYGITYVFSLPFTIIGAVKNFRKKENGIINIWFISAVLLLFICEPNINRCNIIIFPIIYYTIVGINEVINTVDNKIITILIAVIYAIAFISFIYNYTTQDFSTYKNFSTEIKEIVEKTRNSNSEEIKIKDICKEPYIYFLFYNKENPHYFIETVKYFNDGREFENVKSYGKYKFYCESE